MAILTLLVSLTNPFYDGNFFLPIRSLSMFSNPSGLGVSPGAEAFVTYNPETERITAGASAGYLGFGYIKEDTFQIYEVGVGYSLPGAFTVGYAYEFGDTSVHILGVECRPNQQLALSYKTGFGEKKYMFGGVGIMPYLHYITLNFGLAYEGIDDTMAIYYGARITPIRGLSVFFTADKEFNWNAGLELSFGYGKIAGMYSYETTKFSGGLLISSQKYETFLP
ncbi:MAG: hypothetical protein JSV53_06035 [candidate division WOR-3 bacterium]|nr:MAG: hypothetical protein JSV53_06035 [candidate division WOR-3 bacterium]